MSSQVLLESSHASSLPPGMVMAGAEVAHRFSSGGQQGGATTTGLCKGIELRNNNQSCVLHHLCAGGLVFGSNPLEEGAGSDAFEVRIDAVDSHYAGALKIGVTTVQGCNSFTVPVRGSYTSKVAI